MRVRVDVPHEPSDQLVIRLPLPSWKPGLGIRLVAGGVGIVVVVVVAGTVVVLVVVVGAMVVLVVVTGAAVLVVTGTVEVTVVDVVSSGTVPGFGGQAVATMVTMPAATNSLAVRNRRLFFI